MAIPRHAWTSSSAAAPWFGDTRRRPAAAKVGHRVLTTKGRMAAKERKRPWYLVLALLGALTLGTCGASVGWGRVLLYREAVDATTEGIGIADEAQRQLVVARAQEWITTLDDAKARGWPLAIASLLLGTAILVFGVRTLGGSGGVRTALVQLVIAQAGVNAADYYLMRESWDAQQRFFNAKHAAWAHVEVDAEEARRGLRVAMMLSTFGSALVVFGLTRPRSRQFLDAVPGAVEER